MAIDSIDKRKSAAWPSLYVAPSVEPDATQPLEWRQSAGFGYYGISVSSESRTISTGITWDWQIGEGVTKAITPVPLDMGFVFVDPTKSVPEISGTLTTYIAVGGLEHLDPGSRRRRPSPLPEVPNVDQEAEE